MVKAITIVGFLCLAVAFNANANDSDRIDQLENKIHEIELRLSNLESLLKNSSNAQELVTPGEGWKSVRNWRKLVSGMKPKEVQKILGEPHRVAGSTIASWYYENGGQVNFFKGKVRDWSEPRE